MTFFVVVQEDIFLHIYETRMLPKMVCCSKLNKGLLNKRTCTNMQTLSSPLISYLKLISSKLAAPLKCVMCINCCVFDSRISNAIFLFIRKCLCCWPTGGLRHCTCSKL